MTEYPDYLEAVVHSIEVEESRRGIVIRALVKGKEAKTITLMSVDRFLLTEMREHNVIENVVQWGRNERSEEFIDLVSFLITQKRGKDVEKEFAPVVKAALEKIRTGELTLVSMSAVYGAELVALAKDVRIE